MAEIKRYDEQSRYVKGQATKQISYEIREFYKIMAERLSIEEAKALTWQPLMNEEILASFYNTDRAEYVVPAVSREGRLINYCIYPKELLEKAINKYSESYFNDTKAKKPTDSQLEYAKGMLMDLNESYELPTDNYFVFVATFKILIHSYKGHQQQQKIIREQEFEARMQMDPASERQITAIQNSYNHFAKGKRQIDQGMLSLLSKHDASIIFDLFKGTGTPLELVGRVDSFLVQLRKKWA